MYSKYNYIYVKTKFYSHISYLSKISLQEWQLFDINIFKRNGSFLFKKYINNEIDRQPFMGNRFECTWFFNKNIYFLRIALERQIQSINQITATKNP